MPQTRVGISGWTYEPWRKVFYPEGLPIKRELEHASRKLNSIEINGSFCSMRLAARLGGEASPDAHARAPEGAGEEPRESWPDYGRRHKRGAAHA